MLAYGLLFGWLSLERYWGYEMHALDMGNMAQAAWNTVHGHPFFFTDMRLPYALEAWGTTTRLSFHVEPLFPVISLVYLIYPHPESLLILQTIAIDLGAIPVYLIARDALRSKWLALVFALAYLLFPALEAMNLYEFHPVSLATTLLLFAFLFASKQQYIPFAVCALAALWTKEQLGLTVAMFGLYVAYQNRDRLLGIVTAAIALVWSLFATLVIEKHYRQAGAVTYFHTRYGYLGHGIRSALHTFVHNPGILGNVLLNWAKLGYILGLFASVGYTAILSPIGVLLGAPSLILNLLSYPSGNGYTDYHMYSGLGDNNAELIAVFMIAGILGARILIRLLGRRMSGHAAISSTSALVLLVTLWNNHAYGFTPSADRFQVPLVGRHQNLADKFVGMIPSSVPVSTQDQLEPHLASRHYVYLFEDTGRQLGKGVPKLAPADYILLDASAPSTPLPSYQIHDRAMSWLNKPGWGVAAAQDGLILLENGAKSKDIPASFYSYLNATIAPSAKLTGQTDGLQVLGYDVRKEDLSNHRIPDLRYSFYLRAPQKISKNVQPVISEFVGNKQSGCERVPDGLAWFPTSKWSPGHVYKVGMDPIETDWQSPGTARLYLSFSSVSKAENSTCSRIWNSRGKTWPIGTLDIQF